MRSPLQWIRQARQNQQRRFNSAWGRCRRPNRRLQVEGLESRYLLSVTLSEFPIPTVNSVPLGITTGPDGNLWFTENSGNEIGRINPTTHAITQFPLPTANSSPSAITSGPDGNLWFTEPGSNKVAVINPTTHAIADFPIPTANSDVGDITAGPDGNLWFTELNVNQIGQINPATHIISEFSIPTANSTPLGITSGPDGNLWFTEFDGNKIGQINPTTHAIAEFPLPAGSNGLGAITSGPDGNLWFTERNSTKIGEINPTTHAIVDFTLPAGAASPRAITAGPDGNLWFTESNEDTSKIGDINPTTHTIADFPTITARSAPSGITSGPDGNLWFTEETGNNIGQVVLAAPPTAADLALSGTAPASVASGQNVSYTLTVTNNGTAGATGVTLTDTLPAGVTFVSATSGVTPVKGVLTFPLGNLAAGATASVTIVVTPTAAGTLIDQANVKGNQTDPTPADDSITEITTVRSAPGPSVTSVHRFGIHAQPTLLVLTFDQPLNPERAQDPGNYQIVVLGGTHRNIRVRSAVYDAAARTVTLSPVHRLNLHNLFRLTVIGTGPSGVTDSSGNLLNGQRTGDPGSNFVTIVAAADLVMTTKSPAILRAYHKILSSQSSILNAAGLDRAL